MQPIIIGLWSLSLSVKQISNVQALGGKSAGVSQRLNGANSSIMIISMQFIVIKFTRYY